jgi:hypothetical protein
MILERRFCNFKESRGRDKVDEGRSTTAEILKDKITLL